MWSFPTSHLTPVSPLLTVVPPAAYSAVPCMSSPTPWSSSAPCSSIAYQPIASTSSCSLTVILTAHSSRGSSQNYTNSNHAIPWFLLTFIIFFCNTPVLPDVLWTTPQELQLSSAYPQNCSTDPQFPPTAASWTGNTRAVTPSVAHALTAWLVPASCQVKLTTYLWS